MSIGSGVGTNRYLSGSQGMQAARLFEQLGYTPADAERLGMQLDQSRGDLAGVERLRRALESGLSMAQTDQIFGRGLPPRGFVPRPMDYMRDQLMRGGGYDGSGINPGAGYSPFGGGVSRESPFGTGRMGRSIEKWCSRDPFFKAQIEKMLGGVIVPDGRRDGVMSVWRPPFNQVGTMMRDVVGQGMLPKVGIAAALAGMAIPMAGPLVANAMTGGILRMMQRFEGNVANFGMMMSGQYNNVDASRNRMMGDLESMQHANSMGINLKNASFEDIIFLLLMKYTAKKEKEIMNKVNQLGANGQNGMMQGLFGGLVSAAGGAAGFALGGPLGAMLGSSVGQMASGALMGNGTTMGNVFDQQGNVGDPSKMSETAKQQALQKLMGDLQKLYEMLSNMIKSMHDMQMTPVRNLRG